MLSTWANSTRRVLVHFIALFAFGAAADASCLLSSGTSTSVTLPMGQQPFDVYTPPGSTDRGPSPLVVLLHGSTGTGQDMLRASGLVDTADRHGFLIAYPDGGIPAKGGFVWNIPGVPTVEGTIPKATDRNDVAYIASVVERLVAIGCVDPARVYVTGLSGGGRMASWLGCVASDRFAAIVPVVGLRAGTPLASDPSRPDPRSCRPSRPIPVMTFAGDQDTTNPIAGGGAVYWRYSMHAAEQRWARMNHCTAPPTTTWLDATTYEERYGDCRGNVEVIAHVSVGKGHEWAVDNEALWRFMARHRRTDIAP